MGAFEEVIKNLEKLKKLLEQSRGPFPQQPTIMEPQSHSQKKKEEGSRNEFHSKGNQNSSQQPFDDPLSALMQLRQLGSVEQYQDAFDALLIRIEDLPIGHAISCFLSGLNSEIQHTVRMFEPKTLHDAYCLAKLQEATLASIARKKPILKKPTHLSPWVQPFRQHFSATSSNSATSSAPKTTTRPVPSSSSYQPQSSSQGSSNSRFRKPLRPLTIRELDDRRARSLCFYCDERYTPSHKCKAQIYKIELGNQEDEDKENLEEEVGTDFLEDPTVVREEIPHISMNALSAVNGSKLASSFVCQDLQWSIGEYEFHSDPQVFEESSKPNTYINLNEWDGNDQENSQEVVSSKQLDGFHMDKGTSDAQQQTKGLLHDVVQEQPGNVQSLSDEMPKKLKAPKWYEQSGSEEVFKLDQIYTCEQLGIGFVSSKLLPVGCPEFSQKLLKEVNQQPKKPVHLPFIWDWQWILGPKLEYTEASWSLLFAENYGWKQAESYYFLSFDPGGTLHLSQWLFPVSHTIHDLEAVRFVFDSGAYWTCWLKRHFIHSVSAARPLLKGAEIQGKRGLWVPSLCHGMGYPEKILKEEGGDALTLESSDKRCNWRTAVIVHCLSFVGRLLQQLPWITPMLSGNISPSPWVLDVDEMGMPAAESVTVLAQKNWERKKLWTEA